MTSVAVEVATCAIALAGILVMLGARKIGWRVFAVGIILIVAATVLSPARPVNIGVSNVASR